MYPFLLPKQKWQEQAPTKKSREGKRRQGRKKKSKKKMTSQGEKEEVEPEAVGRFFFYSLYLIG